MRSLRAYWKPKPQTRAPDRPNKMTLDLTSLLIVNLNWTRLVGIGAREPQSPWARKVQNRYGNEKSNTEERIKGYLTGLDRTRRYNTAWMVVVMYHGSSRRWTRFVLSFRNDTFEIVLAIFLFIISLKRPLLWQSCHPRYENESSIWKLWGHYGHGEFGFGLIYSRCE